MATTVTRTVKPARPPRQLAVRRRRGGSGTRENIAGWALAAPSAVLLGLFFVLPSALTVWMSFFNWPALGSATWAGLRNYSQLLSDPSFAAAVRFTLEYTAVTTIAGLAAAMGLALLVRPRFRFRTAIRALLFAPVTIGFAPAGLLWLSMSNARTGVLPVIARAAGLATAGTDWFAHPSTTLAIVVVMTIWKTAGLAMLVLIIGMDAVPAEVYEAARLDGASHWSILTRITLPLIRKPLSLVTLLTMSLTFLAFDQFYTMTHGGPDNSTVTVVYYLYNAAFVALNRGYAAAVAVVIVIVLAVVSVPQVMLQRGKG